MARCGCGSSDCNCVIIGGANTNVSGTGKPDSPYRIDALDQGLTTVLDTSTLDLSITGDGKPGDEYELSGAVKVSASPGNILTINPDGLAVFCGDVAECSTPGGDISVGDGLTGNGSPATPLEIKGLVPWDFACPESEATPLYLLADGSVAAPPPNTCQTAQVGLGVVTGMAGFCGLVTAGAGRVRLSSQPNRLNYHNNDECRSAIVELKASGVIWMTGDGADGTNPNQWINQLLIGLMINGVAGSIVQQVGLLGDGFLSYRIDYPAITVAPGGDLQIGSFVDGQTDVACHVENSQFQHPNIILTSRTCG